VLTDGGLPEHVTSARRTCSALNGYHRFSVISPCICRRTAEASGASGAIGCSAGAGAADDLRRKAGSRLLEGAMPEHHVQRVLDHAKLSPTPRRNRCTVGRFCANVNRESR
jgi:hypothetical protein